MIDAFMRDYEGTDWKSVLLNAINRDWEEFGNKSLLNECSIGYCGDLIKMPKKEQDKYLEDALIKCNIGQGGILRLEQLGYMVCKTHITYTNNIPGQAAWWMACGRNAEAVLISEHSGQWQVVNTGTLEQMKKKANELLRRTKYAFDCYIITNNIRLICTGNIKKYKTTTKVTNKEQLVTPYYRFKIFGRVDMK